MIATGVSEMLGTFVVVMLGAGLILSSPALALAHRVKHRHWGIYRPPVGFYGDMGGSICYLCDYPGASSQGYSGLRSCPPDFLVKWSENLDPTERQELLAGRRGLSEPHPIRDELR